MQFFIFAVVANSSLIQKVYLPKYIFIFEKCLFSLINMIFSSVAVLFVIIYYVVKGEVKLHLTMFLIFIPMTYTLLFSIGVGLILATFTVFFRDIVHIWGVVLTIWLYLTPIVYPMEILKSSNIDWVVRLNPVFYFVDDLRSLMILGRLPSLWNIGFESCVCLLSLIFGFLLFKKAQDRFILHI